MKSGWQFAGEVLFVGVEVHQPMPGEIEKDGALLSFFFCPFGFPDGLGDSVGGFRCGDNAFRAGEEDACLEGLGLGNACRFDVPVFQELAGGDTRTVVAQPTGMDACRGEGVPEGVHG